MILEQSPLPFHTSVPTVLGYPAWKRALQESLSYNLVQLTLYILGVQLCLLCGRQLHYEGTWCFSQFSNSCNANLMISLSKKIRDLYFCSLFWRFKFNIESYSFLPPLMNVTHHLQEQVLSAQNRRQRKPCFESHSTLRGTWRWLRSFIPVSSFLPVSTWDPIFSTRTWLGEADIQPLNLKCVSEQGAEVPPENEESELPATSLEKRRNLPTSMRTDSPEQTIV